MTTKILIIDDSATVRQQVTRALAGAGFSVVEAGDGAIGLEQLTAHPDVSLVVCDVNMPRMNGLEFLERVRTAVPIVMLTTEGQPELMVRARSLGAKAWILKPFKPDMLVAAARKITGAT